MIELNERVYELLKRQMANVSRVQGLLRRDVKSHLFEIIFVFATFVSSSPSSSTKYSFKKISSIDYTKAFE